MTTGLHRRCPSCGCDGGEPPAEGCNCPFVEGKQFLPSCCSEVSVFLPSPGLRIYTGTLPCSPGSDQRQQVPTPYRIFTPEPIYVPLVLSTVGAPPDGPNYIYRLKWDDPGFRYGMLQVTDDTQPGEVAYAKAVNGINPPQMELRRACARPIPDTCEPCTPQIYEPQDVLQLSGLFGFTPWGCFPPDCPNSALWFGFLGYVGFEDCDACPPTTPIQYTWEHQPYSQVCSPNQNSSACRWTPYCLSLPEADIAAQVIGCPPPPPPCWVRAETCPFTVDNEPDCLDCCMQCEPGPDNLCLLDGWPYYRCDALPLDGSDVQFKCGNCCFFANYGMEQVDEIPPDGQEFSANEYPDGCLGPDNNELDYCCEYETLGPCPLDCSQVCNTLYSAVVKNVQFADGCGEGPCCHNTVAGRTLSSNGQPTCLWGTFEPVPPSAPIEISVQVSCFTNPDTDIAEWTALVQWVNRLDFGGGECGATCAFVSWVGMKAGGDCPVGDYLLGNDGTGLYDDCYTPTLGQQFLLEIREL